MGRPTPKNMFELEITDEPIDIIVPTHGRLDLTSHCVKALYANTRHPFRLIVVDDTTPDMEEGEDRTLEWFEKLMVDQRNITFIHSPKPFHSGNQIFNTGLNNSENRFVATVMNSVVAEPDWDIVPVSMMDNNPKIGIIGMKCLKLGWDEKQDGQIESAGIKMSGFTPCDMGRDEPGHRLTTAYPCFSVQWAFALLRRTAVEGQLDPDLWEGFVGFDDIDNSLVLRSRGWEAWYCGFGAGYHHTHATRGRDTTEALSKNRKNAEKFYKRWGYWDLFKQANPYAPEYFDDITLISQGGEPIDHDLKRASDEVVSKQPEDIRPQEE